MLNLFLYLSATQRNKQASFVGNRFNILFYDAAGVFYLKSHVTEYLSNFHGGTLNNRLLQAVLKDLKAPYFVAGCKAMGIIDKLVTGPFWRYLQFSSVSVLNVSDMYTKTRDCFEKWSNDAQTVLENDELLFPDHTSVYMMVLQHVCLNQQKTIIWLNNCSNCCLRASLSQLRGCLQTIFPSTMYLILVSYQRQCRCPRRTLFLKEILRS